MNIFREFINAIYDFSLVVPEDRILLGISGGKDSLTMGFLFSQLQKRQKDRFVLGAVHVRQGPPLDPGIYERFETWGIPLRSVEPPNPKMEMAGCYRCASERRQILMNWAVEQGYTKIALGHHLDDILTTYLMNLLIHGDAQPMAVQRYYGVFGLTLIRPLAYVPEESIRRFVERQGWKTITCSCGRGDRGSRRDFRERLENLTQGSLETKRRMLRALWTPRDANQDS